MLYYYCYYYYYHMRWDINICICIEEHRTFISLLSFTACDVHCSLFVLSLFVFALLCVCVCVCKTHFAFKSLVFYNATIYVAVFHSFASALPLRLTNITVTIDCSLTIYTFLILVLVLVINTARHPLMPEGRLMLLYELALIHKTPPDVLCRKTFVFCKMPQLGMIEIGGETAGEKSGGRDGWYQCQGVLLVSQEGKVNSKYKMYSYIV